MASRLAINFPVARALQLMEEPDSKVRAPALKELCEKYEIVDCYRSMFAKVPVIRNDNGLISLTKTFTAVHKTKQIDGIPSSQICGLAKFLGKANPGEVAGKKSMSSKPLASPYVPKILHAFKTYQDIEYEEWDKEDDNMSLGLGKPLAGILPASDIITSSINEKYIQPFAAELRIAGLTNGQGTENAPHTFQLYVSVIQKLITLLPKSPSGKIEGANGERLEEYLKSMTGRKEAIVALRILLQTYVCNSVSRIPGTMILDIYNWDNVPEPLDVATVDLLPPSKGSNFGKPRQELPF